MTVHAQHSTGGPVQRPSQAQARRRAPRAAVRPRATRHRAPWAGGAALALALVLAGCAAGPGTPAATPAEAIAAERPATWQAAWPHGGDPVGLLRWWQRFQDPLLDTLVAEAQAGSPDLAAATARLAQAQAARTAAAAALGPQLGATAAAVRGRQDLLSPLGTSLSGALQASWEVDLFGGNAARRDAATARLAGARAGWHEARVAVAAETAGSTIAWRACEAQAAEAARDAASRAETARLADLAARAGFQAPADAALARASAAQARSQLAAQQAACALELKTLVALTGRPEPALRAALAGAAPGVPQPTVDGVDAAARVPAQALAQRPDLQAAEQAVVAASADTRAAEARLRPSISLSGSIGAMRVSGGGESASGSTWTLGPLQVVVPLFDGGARRAEVEAARARYDEALAAYRGRLRQAVREVEQALVRLQASAVQLPDAQVALEGYEAAFAAVQARYRGGLASLFELEDARRNAVQARSALLGLQRERSLAWVQLYRALGGGWTAADLPATAASDGAGNGA
ncbi:efflux transporter outer membrane subunit [Piscinibacter sakaiensis]|uniref:Outer membrane protein n=1 Tax=Piscinibacter sakaiensis TaxID=1547922 RepID=A0A0K8P713_PISS1|nr:efflux transporter outer membrane subunit [Piscinibacter sakaiensis]GAP38309.1 outer membrane protein [Piscinibacter sakaiensis]